MADSKTTVGNQKAQGLAKEPVREMSGEEREESLQERENAIAAREARLMAMETKMLAALERLDRATAGTPSEEDLAAAPKVEYDAHGKEIPRLDLEMPYGTVIGDAEAGYVQNGHRFAKDRRYICEEPKGVGKPFNIKMLGLVKAVSKAA